jgi:hypothetical protein
MGDDGARRLRQGRRAERPGRRAPGATSAMHAMTHTFALAQYRFVRTIADSSGRNWDGDCARRVQYRSPTSTESGSKGGQRSARGALEASEGNGRLPHACGRSPVK